MPCQQLQLPFCLLLTAAADAAVFPSPLPLTAPPACRAMSNCTLRFEAIMLLLIENAVYRTTLRPDADSLETLNAVRTLPQGSTRRKAPWQRSPHPTPACKASPFRLRLAQHPQASRTRASNAATSHRLPPACRKRPGNPRLSGAQSSKPPLQAPAARPGQAVKVACCATDWRAGSA